MSFSTIDDLKTSIISTMGSLGSSTSSDIITQGAEQATSELGWSDFPIDDSDKEYWLIERGRRHVILILCVEASSKFQFKKIYLQHRFANYFKLIEMLDKSFDTAIDNNPVLFDNVGPGSSYFTDGLQFITSGFQYNDLGDDLTYIGVE